METTKDKIKVVKGPKASVATFIRPRDGVRIFVFKRDTESVDRAIARVKTANGSAGVEHQLIR